MVQGIVVLIPVLATVLLAVTPAVADEFCPLDSVAVGPLCVDKYEASVWGIPATNTALINMVKQGEAVLGDFEADPLVVQRGVGTGYFCSDNGNNCNQIWAASIPGVYPSASITWFQAQQACANSGKRLLTNAEWQMAAAGTFDPGDNDGNTSARCNTLGNLRETGHAGVAVASSNTCVSRWGTQDMIGNVAEWVADWTQHWAGNNPGSTSTALFGSDMISGINDAPLETYRLPSAIFRGGNHFDGTGAGVFALNASNSPASDSYLIGFRCAR